LPTHYRLSPFFIPAFPGNSLLFFLREFRGARADIHGMNPLAKLLSCAALIAAFPAAHADGDAAHGKQLYAMRCAICHSIEYNGVGPTHKNLIGRKAGSVQGYAYSDALKNSAVIWDEASLKQWLTEPEKFIPGQKMFISIPNAQDRADIVAYLQQVGAKQPAKTP
jgi:cytochrome c